MTALALVLILASALMHATWNLLTKRSVDPLVFGWWLCAVGTLVTLPLAAVSAASSPVPVEGLPYLLATALLHTLYFWFLAEAYARGDLSLVYPVARGLGVLLVVPGAAQLLGETVSAQAAAGALAVVAGLYLAHQSGPTHARVLGVGHWRSPAVGFAALTGLVVAGYTLCDKAGVGLVAAPLYVLAVYLGPSVGLLPIVAARRLPLLGAWRDSRTAILAAGLLSPLSYLLVLLAFSLSRVSYVAPLREVGLIFGAALGYLVLREPLSRTRLAGSTSIALGAALIALAP